MAGNGAHGKGDSIACWTMIASALAGWKTIAFLAGGTLGAVAVAVGATILIYKGVEYLITD